MPISSNVEQKKLYICNMERECRKHGLTKHSEIKGTSGWRCRKCMVEAVTKRRRVVKVKAVEMKGGKCERCGYSKCIDALDFHHRSKDEKEFSISDGGHSRSWERVKAEIEKCELLCANCHREEHSE
jgi:hypothetical protein